MSWWSDPTFWKPAVSASLGTILGAAFVQGLFVIYRDYRLRQSQAAYMAMRLAVILEAHAAACWEFIARNGAEEPHPEGHFTGQITLPVVGPYPGDAEEGWRAIDRRLAGRCLGLPLKISANQVEIGWTGTYDDDEWDDVGPTIHEMAASRGLDAWKLAKELRRKHHIEPADEGLDFSDRLLEAQANAQQALADQRNGCQQSQAPLTG
jgi:hypothetical protein